MSSRPVLFPESPGGRTEDFCRLVGCEVAGEGCVDGGGEGRFGEGGGFEWWEGGTVASPPRDLEGEEGKGGKGKSSSCWEGVVVKDKYEEFTIGSKNKN